MAYFISIVLVALCAVVYVQGIRSLRDLRRDLFADYDKNVRPVKRFSTAVPVTISISPLTLRSLDTSEQVIIMASYLKMEWKDEFLQWDPKDYDNITQFNLPPEEVWKPDLALYTAISDTTYFPAVQTRVIIYNTGMLLWVPPFTLKSMCPRQYKDKDNKGYVECSFKFGSWTYSGLKMDIQLASEEVDLTNFGDFNPNWKLVTAAIDRESKKYPCCEEEYPLVNFNVTLKRRSLSSA